jgi:hypothetical protein
MIRLVELLHERVRRRFEAMVEGYVSLPPPTGVASLTPAETILRGVIAAARKAKQRTLVAWRAADIPK